MHYFFVLLVAEDSFGGNMLIALAQELDLFRKFDQKPRRHETCRDCDDSFNNELKASVSECPADTTIHSPYNPSPSLSIDSISNADE